MTGFTSFSNYIINVSTFQATFLFQSAAFSIKRLACKALMRFQSTEKSSPRDPPMNGPIQTSQRNIVYGPPATRAAHLSEKKKKFESQPCKECCILGLIIWLLIWYQPSFKRLWDAPRLIIGFTRLASSTVVIAYRLGYTSKKRPT